jgi:hypothetical protein
MDTGKSSDGLIFTIILLAVGIAGGIWFLGNTDSKQFGLVSPSVQSVRTYSGIDDEARLNKAKNTLPSNTFGEETLSRLEKQAKGGVLLIDNPGLVSGWTGEKGGLFDNAEIKGALLGTDEVKAAKIIAEQGVKVLVLHEAISKSIDRNKSVLSRLYHHEETLYFSLFRVTRNGLLLYRVQETPVSFSPQTAKSGIDFIRARLRGEKPRLQGRYKKQVWTLVATIRGQGQELATSLAQNKTYIGALNELVKDLERKHRRNVELIGFPPISEHINDLSIELHMVTERAFLEIRDKDWLDNFWEMGIDGAYMMSSDKKSRGVLVGAAAYTQSMTYADQFLRRVALRSKMSERKPWRGKDSWLELIRTIHYREDPEFGLIRLYRGVPAIPLDSVTLENTREAILASGEWYLNNLKTNGQVTYKVWPSENRYSNEYNFVRHTLATWNLTQAYQLDPRPEFLAGAYLALKYTNSKLKREDVTEACKKVEWCDVERLDVSGKMAFYEARNNRKLGSVVVSMMGMIDLAKEAKDHSFDEQLKEMGRFVKFMQLGSGNFEGYYVDKDHSYYGQKNDIVPGEASLAMIMLADYFDDDLWISGLPKFWEYYRPWFDERVAKALKELPLPMRAYTNEDRLELVQFGPWTVMAANAYHKRTGDTDVAQFGFEIARWMIDTYSWQEHRAPFPDYIGGYYKLSKELPAMQAFCYAEGTAAAYAMAVRMDHSEREYLEKATRESVRFGMQMQYNRLNTYAFTRPTEMIGGTRYAMNETKVRIDYVYHAQSAMVQWYQAALQDSKLPSTVRNGNAFPWQLNKDKPIPSFLSLPEQSDSSDFNNK